MMKLLLDTVGDKLQEKKVAYQLLGWDMDGLLRDQFVQGPLLQRLKTDDHLARQIFQCACWATHGEPSDVNAHPHFNKEQSIVVVHNGIIENYLKLKKKLQELAEENQYCDGFD